MVRIKRWWIERISTSFGTWSKPREGATIKARLGDSVDIVVCVELDQVPPDPNTYVTVTATAWNGGVLANGVGTIWFHTLVREKKPLKAACTVVRLHIPRNINAIKIWNVPIGAVRHGKLVKPLTAEFKLDVTVSQPRTPRQLKIMPIQPQPPPHKEVTIL